MKKTMESGNVQEIGKDGKPVEWLQIYSSSATGISPFWKEKYERDAKKYWDVFYKRHQDKFFKDRHYLDKEWGHYFSGEGKKTVLEIGCGAGNTIFPLVATYPEIFIYACDFSPRAVELVKTHKDYTDSHVNAFVCDLTVDDLGDHILPSSVDIVTMIFVLSAVSPDKMPIVLQNVRKVLKPSGYVLFRDYATGDLAQERLIDKDQKISENFYVRGDGTRAFYFSNEFLTSLFQENGFDVKELGVCCKQVENRSRELVMNRRWIQAVFRFSDGINTSTDTKSLIDNKNKTKNRDDIFEVDMSDGIIGAEMFGNLPSNDNEIIKLGDLSFEIKMLSKEHQHTCKSTGLMLWESARLMASLLAKIPSIISGKRVLELGCGSGGICSMVSAHWADLVVPTDGDQKALDLLTQNLASNLKSPFLEKTIVKKLEWGNKSDIESVKQLTKDGFDIIIGTDVTYVAEAVLPLFATAKKLISERKGEEVGLILCHVIRRVDEPSILSAARSYGFRLVDMWCSAIGSSSSRGIISSWFPEDSSEINVACASLNILYFQIE